MLNYISDIEYIPDWIKELYALSTLFMYMVLFVIICKRRCSGETLKSLLLIIFFTIFSLFYCINSDYFNYRNVVDNPLLFYSKGVIETTTFGIALFCNGNYELFRLIIWGSAIVLFYFTSKILKLNSYISLAIWFVFFNGIIFYARATLAMAIYFIGIALIIRSKKKIISSLIGCVCVISSALFHRELLVAIGLAPVIFIQVTNKNYKRIVALILLISIPAIFLVLSNPQLLTDMTNNETYAERFESYQNEIASGAWGGKNIYGYIVMVIRHIIYYLILFVIARVFLKREKRYEKNEGFEAMRKLFQLVFAIIIVATLFFIVFGFGPFFYRILFISAIPLSLLLCYLFINKYISKRTMMCLALFSLFVYTVNLMGI